MRSIKLEGVSFNSDWVSSLTLKEFVAHPANLALWPDAFRRDKIKRLSEVHKAAQGESVAVVNTEGAE